jgi:hypothetical protein
MPNNFHITEDLIAEIEFADLSLQFFKDLLCEHFQDAKRIEVVFVECDEILVDVDGVKYVADENGNVYKYEKD